MSRDGEVAEALGPLGFTDLEARIYAFLLGQSPATGYRVAQEIGKPVANTYKAIASLETKGAVLVDEGAGSSSRQCRAVPVDELLGRLERAFQRQRIKAGRVLHRIDNAIEDDRIYRLGSRDQVLESARRVLQRAEQVVLACLFPGPLDELADDLRATARRGVDLVVKVYQPVEIPGAQVLLSNQARQVVDHWPGQELHLIADGREVVLAWLDRDPEGLIQAIQSRSRFLALTMHNGLACEFALTALSAEIQRRPAHQPLWQTLQRAMRHPMQTPGFVDVQDRFPRALGPSHEPPTDEPVHD